VPYDGVGKCPRETFRGAPAFVQPIITLVSGKPLTGTRPKLNIKPWMAILIDYTKYTTGIVGAALSVQVGGGVLFLLPLFWILIVNGARSLTSDAHYAGHGAVTGHKKFDMWLGNILSLTVISSNMKDYAQSHNRDHHGKLGIGTQSDPDIGMVRMLGFRMGMNRSYYWWRLILSIISPRYHFHYTMLRLRSTFATAPVWRIMVAWVALVTITYITCAFHLEKILFLSWLLPIGPLYAVSAALQFPSEHMWLSPQCPDEDRRSYLLRVSHGRFFLIPSPAPANVLGWMIWAIRMVPLLFMRFFVCVSILPAHDYHHRFASRRDWPMEIFLRQADQDAGAIYKDYFDIWMPMKELFNAWSKLPKDTLAGSFTMLGLIGKVINIYK